MKTRKIVALHLIITILFLFPSLATSQQSAYPEFDKVIENWDHLHSQKRYFRAIEQAQHAFRLAEELNQKELMAIALNRGGTSLMKIAKRVKKNRKEAAKKFKQSLEYLGEINNPTLRIDNLQNLKWLAHKNNDRQLVALYQKQIEAVNSLAETNETNEILSGQLDSLAIQKEQLSNKIDSLSDAQLKSELLIALQKNQVDSFAFERTKDSLLLKQNELRMSEQEATLSLQRSQRNLLFALACIIGFLAIGAVLRYKETKTHNNLLESKNKVIEEEKKRSDELLLNILPNVVAQELKSNGVAKAKKFETATVLFSDFENFSAIAKGLSPEQLVHELDFHFKAFDRIIGEHNLEKIKTIGDAYMCVGGLPEERPDHAKAVVNAAIDIQDYLQSLKIERAEKGKVTFEARIGIHSGPLVAGVVGSRKFAYDIWGDTVNVAARLEAQGEVGKVNISAATHKFIRDEFNCEDRGKIPVKNMGEVGMYFVSRP